MFTRFFDWLSNLSPRSLLALAGISALVIGSIMYAALSIFSSPATQTANPNNPEGDGTGQVVKTKAVVIAAVNIEEKSIIREKMLETKEFPESSLPPDAITNIDEIKDKAAKVKIFKGEVITTQKFYRDLAQSGFVGSIPPDCRAISIGINDVTGVAGFAKPGDYVDIFLTEKADNTVSSRLILQDVLLLSINKSMGVENGGGGNDDKNESTDNPETQAIEAPGIATLALRPDEILELVTATKLGDISLALRPLVPQSDYITGARYTIETLKGQQAKQAEAGTMIPPESKIEIIYGDKDTKDDKKKSE